MVKAVPDVLERHSELLHAYSRHLGAERGRSVHTRRAYLGDVRHLLTFAAARGIDEIGDLRIGDLRAWLGIQADAGAARSTIARRAASARTFLRWAEHTGRIPTDPSLRLVAPKRHATLPGVLRQGEATEMLDLAATRADDDDPVHVRDRAVLELLYASGIRVGELAALDIDDVDLAQGVVRVMGKGSKERIVPFGAPAGRAIEGWLSSGRGWPGNTRVPRCSSDGGAAGWTRARSGRLCTSCSRTSLTRRTSARTACVTARPPTCSRAARIFAWSRRSSATPVSRRPRSTRTSRSTGSAAATRRPIRAPDRSPADRITPAEAARPGARPTKDNGSR